MKEDSNANWIVPLEKGTLVRVYVQPSASSTGLAGVHGERLKLKIKSPPEDGKANKELVGFIAKILGVSMSMVFVLRGESSRQKDLLIELSPEKVVTCLEVS